MGASHQDRLVENSVRLIQLLLGAWTLLGAPGIATRSKKLLPGTR